VQGYELVEVKERVTGIHKLEREKHENQILLDPSNQIGDFDNVRVEPSASANVFKADNTEPYSNAEGHLSQTNSDLTDGGLVNIVDEEQADGTLIRTKKVRKPILKKTFALKRIGYKVIPYEDDTDSRYSFTTENIVFVNKANPTYRAEATRGDEFLMRHVISIVAEAVAQEKHPEGKEALELQNRLVAEAIRIHDTSVIKR
jgi:hypothetical protein